MNEGLSINKDDNSKKKDDDKEEVINQDEQNFSKNFYKNADNFFTADKIVSKRVLGNGSYGKIFEIELQKGTHIKKFALKDYSKCGVLDNGCDLGQIYKEEAFNKYQKLKKAQIKTFSTFRASKDKPQLIMTLGTNDDFTLVSGNDKFNGRPHIDHMISTDINFDRLLNSLENNILKAYKLGIFLPHDSYFFIIKKSNIADIDFVIGDLDFITFDYSEHKNVKNGEKWTKEKWVDEDYFKKNVQEAYNAVIFSLPIYVEKEEDINKYKKYFYMNLKNFGEKNIKNFILYEKGL